MKIIYVVKVAFPLQPHGRRTYITCNVLNEVFYKTPSHSIHFIELAGKLFNIVYFIYAQECDLRWNRIDAWVPLGILNR